MGIITSKDVVEVEGVEGFVSISMCGHEWLENPARIELTVAAAEKLSDALDVAIVAARKES